MHISLLLFHHLHLRKSMYLRNVLKMIFLGLTRLTYTRS